MTVSSEDRHRQNVVDGFWARPSSTLTSMKVSTQDRHREIVSMTVCEEHRHRQIASMTVFFPPRHRRCTKDPSPLDMVVMDTCKHEFTGIKLPKDIKRKTVSRLSVLLCCSTQHAADPELGKKVITFVPVTSTKCAISGPKSSVPILFR